MKVLSSLLFRECSSDSYHREKVRRDEACLLSRSREKIREKAMEEKEKVVEKIQE